MCNDKNKKLRQLFNGVKAFEFPAKVTSEGKFQLPDTLLQRLPANQDIRVIVLVNEATESEDKAWSQLGAEQLLAGYSEADSIYDTI